MIRHSKEQDEVEVSNHHLIAMILRGEGEQAAWDSLLARYSKLIYSVPLRYGLQESDAADVYQAVCVALWQGLADLRDADRLSGWLLTVAGKISWRVLMKRRRQGQYEAPVPETDALVDDSSGHPEDMALRRDDWRAVAAAVRALPERCRQLIWYLYYDASAPSYDEIARQMGLAEGSIGPIRARCLAQLKKQLHEDVPSEAHRAR
jgi:RNA polymerase sigma factor (sigma-70 family)